MYAQVNEQISSFTQQFAANAARINRLALENAESVFGVQLKTLEKNLNATSAYFNEVAEARDFNAYQNLWSKAVQVARDNTERLTSAGQEVLGLTLKTSEALGELTKRQFETATQQATATVNAAKAEKAK